MRRALSPTPPRIPVGCAVDAHAGPAAAMDGVDDLRVAGAAAEVARERLADVVAARRGRARAGRSPPRPGPACRSRTGPRPRSTNARCTGCSSVPRPSASTVPTVAALRLHGEHEAGADDLAVEPDRAGAALALLAGVLGAVEAEPSRSTESRLAARRASTGRRTPLTVGSIITPLSLSSGLRRAPGARAPPTAWRR